MFKIIFLIGIIVAFSSFKLDGQTSKSKLSFNSLQEAKEDTLKVNTLIEAAERMIDRNNDSLYILANKALETSQRINYKIGIGKAFGSLGIYYSIEKDYTKALNHFKAYLNIATELNSKRDLAYAYDILGYFYYENQNYTNAIGYFNSALKYYKELKNLSGAGIICKNLSSAYYYINKPVESTIAANEAINIYTQLKDSIKISEIFINLSLSYGVMKEYKKVIEYSQKAIKSLEKRNEVYILWIPYFNIAVNYELLGEFDKSLDYYKKSLALANKNKDAAQIGSSEAGLASTYYELHEYEKALKHSNNSLQYTKLTKDRNFLTSAYQIASKINIYFNDVERAIKYANFAIAESGGADGIQYRIDSYERLSIAYAKKEDYKTSLEYYQKFKSGTDSVYNQDVASKLTEMQTRYETEKKDQENMLLKKQHELTNEIVKRQYYLIFGISAGFLLLFCVAAFFIYLNSHKKKTNKILVKQKLEIEALADKLQELNATKDKFFSIIAHDLKNPFHALLSVNSLLMENDESLSEEKRHEFLLKMYQTTEHAYTLLENLLQWSRSQMGRIEYDPEEIYLRNLIESNRLLLKNIADEKDITIDVKVDNNMAVYADKNMMDTILRNLTTNALKFTEDNGNIIISAEEREKSVVVSVADTGIGIGAEDQENLFKLTKVPLTYGTRNEKGTGLGLILCKEFVEKQHGKIWVESKKGFGSTFFFTVPKFIPSTE